MSRRALNLAWNIVCGISVCLTGGAAFAATQPAELNRPVVVTRTLLHAAPFIQLATAPIGAAVRDLNGDGKPDLVFTREGVSFVTVMLGDGVGGFSSTANYAAGIQPGQLILADLKGRGILDIAVVDKSSASVKVLYGNGDGTFAPAVSFPTLANSLNLVVGNFGGSGRDLAVITSSGAAILLNDGSGGFASPVIKALATSPVAIAAGDFSSSGLDDLALANQDGTLTVLQNRGHGLLNALSPISISGSSLSSIVAGNFNGDGNLDLAVARPASNDVAILLGRGDGSFQAGATYIVGGGPVNLLSADFRGSGVSDLVTVNLGDDTFSVLTGNGDGTFTAVGDFVAGNAPVAAVAGAFYGDGHLDLAVLNSGDRTIDLPRGLGDGTFRVARAYPAELEPVALTTGDLTGNGLTDLVAANSCGADPACVSAGSASVFMAHADGTYTQTATYPLGLSPAGIALAKVTGSANLDLLAINRGDKTLTVMPGNGDGTFSAARTIALTNSPRAFAVGDFNSDGKPDLAILSDCGQSSCTQSGTLDIWLGKGDGTFAAAASYKVGYSPVSLAAGDLRGTGSLDLVVANACGLDSSCASGGTASVFFNDGAGGFSLANSLSIGSGPTSIALGKIVGASLDLAVASGAENQVLVLKGDGQGGFGAATSYAVGSKPAALLVADLYHDGFNSIATADSSSSTVSILRGTASGTLETAVSYPVAVSPVAIAILGAVNGGGVSLATASAHSGAPLHRGPITLYKGVPGTGTETPTVTLTNPPITSTVDNQVTLNAKVTGASGTPTGHLEFSIDLGLGNFNYLLDCGGGSPGVVLSGTGTATCATQLLTVNPTPNVVAQYQGDSTYMEGNSTDQAETISPANTKVTVGLTTAGTVDQQVTLTANVAPNPPPTVSSNDAVSFAVTGTIKFLSDGSAISGCDAQPVMNNAAIENAAATCQTAALTATGSPHAITAEYNAGDPNYNGSASVGSQNQTIQPAPTTVSQPSLVSPASPTVDQMITVSATVQPTTGTVVVPFSGSMKFLNGIVPIAGCAAVPVNVASGNSLTGTAQCSISAGLADGTYSITAEYNANALDLNYNPSAASPALSLTVAKAPTSVAVTPATQSATVDSSVSFTATVSPNVTTEFVGNSNVTPIAGGTVTFTDTTTGTTLCSSGSFNMLPNGTATASCSTTALTVPGNPNAISVTFNGDPNYLTSSSTTSAAVTMTQATPSFTSLVPSVTTANLGSTVTFTATITAPGNGVPLGGSVTFLDNGSPASCTGGNVIAIGTTAGSPVGTAICSTNSMSATTHVITATYGSDPNYFGVGPAIAATVTINANTAGTVGLTISPVGSSTINQQVTFTITVAHPASTPLTGTPTLTENGLAVPGCTLSPISPTNTASGSSTCTTSSLAVGSHNFVAMYSDSNGNDPGNGTAGYTVGKQATSLTVSQVPSGSTVNQSVTFTAKITFTNPGLFTPSLTVGFTDSATSLAIPGCSAVALSLVNPTTYQAQCTTTALAVNGHTITATYVGDANFAGINGMTNITVQPATSAVSLTSTLNPSNFSQQITFTAFVTPFNASVPLSALGTVEFQSNGVDITGCAAQPITPATGVATCQTAALAVGTNITITAIYQHDPSYLTNSGTLFQTVNPVTALLPLTLTALPLAPTVNSTVTFTATFSASLSSTLGTVKFTDQTNPSDLPASCSSVIPSQTPGNGGAITYTASCSSSSLNAGTHVIQAMYSGSVILTVGPNTTSVTVSTATSTVLAPVATLPSSVLYVNNTKGYQDSVTFTVNVTPINGNPGLSGAVTFNGVPSCQGAPPATPNTVSVTPATGVAICTTTSLPAGSNTITATYGGDPNYTKTTSSPTTQDVADYSISVANVPTTGSQSAPLGVQVTQGYTTSTDPFPPVPPIGVSPNSIYNYASTGTPAPVTITCSSSAAGAPACLPGGASSASIQILPGVVEPSVNITIDATGGSVALGTYTFTVTAVDSTTGLTRTTTFPVTVRPGITNANALHTRLGRHDGQYHQRDLLPSEGRERLLTTSICSIDRRHGNFHPRVLHGDWRG
jgi:hypothetical protein